MRCWALKGTVLIVAMAATAAGIGSARALEESVLPAETDAERRERMEWWRDARLGMFIHWGTYALPARHEWVKKYEQIPDADYQKYFEHFDPDLYDPAEWARMAKDAGMKYVVITTKHHEGFCLWDSEYTDYKATNTPYGKDLLKPFVEAFRAEGIRIGFYYSLIDWHHPEYPLDRVHPMWNNAEYRETNQDRDISVYQEYLHNQVRELMTEFGQIDHFFPDYSFPGEHGKGRDDWKSVELLKMVRELQPQIIVNDRLDLIDVPGGWDFRTPEQLLPREWVEVEGKRVPWETCQTFSGSWGYHRDEHTWKSGRQIIAMLIEVVSKGGNLLLNVGPTARGTFDARAQERLADLGDWMEVHDRAIYGCTQAPDAFPKPDNCLLTYNAETNRLYVHVLEWPIRYLHLDGFGGNIKYAQLLHDASEVRFAERRGAWMSEETCPATVTLDLPVIKPDVEIPVIELYLK